MFAEIRVGVDPVFAEIRVGVDPVFAEIRVGGDPVFVEIRVGGDSVYVEIPCLWRSRVCGDPMFVVVCRSCVSGCLMDWEIEGWRYVVFLFDVEDMTDARVPLLRISK